MDRSQRETEEVRRMLNTHELGNSPSQEEQLADKGHQQTEQAASKAHEVIDTVRDKVHEAVDTVKGKAQEQRQSGQEKTAEVKEKVQAYGEQAHARADAAMTTSGERLDTLAQQVREKAPEGKVGEIAHRTADAMEQSANYLQRATPTDVRNDLETTIRKNPTESLLAGLGIGFLLAQLTKRR
ncbi:MAG: hypothetical protein GFH27_549303n214 [Chloroflexi bacterium AL-W]|nr:hypothetical protein [Chloroflexi bacterium AL-N1]NOK68099.1 hypothetical protein [Chloroflexi bacterium AL-N10]NOK73439.1 hypothetical protein [Chloroflexi bacterium AL-N5]NOK83353.1 hypothetical protein [Chloroflexi bacterium AL-W]NOK87770.1 hypothetical protein [Chloroflexi bacterium AL-N15]